MNCTEIAAVLQETLLHQRDPQWVWEARRHAERCPGCARLLELHHVEERLAGLPAIEPSIDLVESVMNRVTQPQPVAIWPAGQLLLRMLKYATMVLGALILASAYLVPGAGQSWLANLWPSARSLELLRLSVYVSQHPPWAMILAAFATLLILMGLALPEPQVGERVYSFRGTE